VRVALRPTTRVALFVALEAVLFWAGFVLIGWGVLYGVPGGLVGIWLGSASLTDSATRSRERAARAAVREHRDPGPGLRTEADTQARTILAASAVDRWGPAMVLLGVASSCVVVAVVRNDPPVAFPSPALVVLTVVAVVLRRRVEAAADRWLADPPVPASDEVDR
jgi:hypothetical protein